MTDQPVDPIETPSAAIAWTPTRRFWVSLLLLFHLFCVVLAPLAVVDPRSGLAVETQRLLRPYGESLYMIHGYRYFAPEPGPGHTLHYEITTHSGETIKGQFPDRSRDWPRLLYHRWFMLSETVYGHVSETLDIKELDEWKQQVADQITALVQTDPRAAEDLEKQLQRELAENDRISIIRDRLVTSIGKQLLHKHQGEVIEMKLVTRVIPPPQDIEKGLKLEHERYMPAELTYALGTVYSDRNGLESITPQPEAPTSSPNPDDGKGREGQR